MILSCDINYRKLSILVRNSNTATVMPRGLYSLPAQSDPAQAATALMPEHDTKQLSTRGELPPTQHHQPETQRTLLPRHTEQDSANAKVEVNPEETGKELSIFTKAHLNYRNIKRH